MSKKVRRRASLVEAVERRLLMATNSWKAAVSGDWDTAGNWSLGHVPLSTEDAAITIAGAYTVTHSTTASDFVQSLTVDESLTIAAGTIEVMSGGMTINNTTVTLSAASSAAELEFNTSSVDQTLDGTGSIVFAGSTPANDEILDVNGSTLTIGANITIHGAGGQLTTAFGNPGFINKGVIDSDTSGQTITIAGTIENQNLIEATNGASLAFHSSHYTNDASGTISITGGGALTTGDNNQITSSNAGTISETNSTLNLGNNFSDTGTITRSGGTVNLTGIINQNGGAFTLNTALGQWFLLGGGFQNTTLSFTGSGLLTATSSGGVFNGVTLASNFNIPDGAHITVTGGLTFSNNAIITLASAGAVSQITFDTDAANETVGGSGAIDFAGSSPANDELVDFNGDTLTIGANVTIHGAGGQLITDFSNPGFINKGVINSDTAGQTITISGSFENMGTAEATNGGNLTINNFAYNNDASGIITITGGGTLTVGTSQGTISTNAGAISETNSVLNLGSTFTSTGTITRSGGTVNLTGVYNLNGGALTLNTALGIWNMPGGLENGTLTFSGTGGLTLQGTAGFFSNITLNSNLIIPDGVTFIVRNGLTLNNSAKLRLKSVTQAAQLRLDDSSSGQTIGGNGMIIFAGSAPTPDSIFVLNESGVATIGSGIEIQGTTGNITDAFNEAGLTNNGIIAAIGAGGTIAISSQGFTNKGELEAAPGKIAFDGAFDASQGALTIGIGGTVAGTSYGKITAVGAITLGGTLDTPLLPGFIPTAGQVFTPLTYASATGSFTTQHTSVGGGVAFNFATGASSATLTATTGGSDFADISSALLTVNGTNSADTISLSQSFDLVSAVVNGATNVFFANRITNELVMGNFGNDSITSGLSNDTLQGNGGDDTIVGSNGSDTLQGAGGNDSINGAGGNDSLRGGAGTDSLNGAGGNDVVVGGGDNDTVLGGTGNDTVAGGPGNDSVVGGTGTDYLIGGVGNDTLDATSGVNDTLDISVGVDSLIGQVAGDSIIG